MAAIISLRRLGVGVAAFAVAAAGAVFAPANADPVLHLSIDNFGVINCSPTSQEILASIGGSGDSTGSTSHIIVSDLPANLLYSVRPSGTNWYVTIYGVPQAPAGPYTVTVTARADAQPPRAISASLVIDVTGSTVCTSPTQPVASYTVSFNANGGVGTMSSQSSTTAAALTGNVFTRAGYSFSSWNTKADGTGSTYADKAVFGFTSSLTLYAQWTALPSFQVTFDPNKGSGTLAPMTANLPTALSLNTFSRVGWKFTGWNTSADGTGTAYADGATYPFTAAATLYAQWQPMRSMKTAKLLFADLSTVMSKQGKARLQAIARYFGKADVTVSVIGYVRKAGSDKNNYTLSTARATVVASYLRALGLTGTYTVRGDGIAPERGAPGRKVLVTVRLTP